ncbi:MAG: hypothetical protein GY710_26060 [Desulfobacteraceae bacterium]|nr:hypothetical protein [Desulfobacteraceae bacterium]
MDQNSIFTQNMKFPYSAIGASGQIRIDRLLNLFQDLASHHCDTLCVSGIDMAKQQLKWVVSRYQIRIYKNPKWLESLELKTWRSPWKNLYELRQFSIVNQDQEELVSALGIWILVKAENSKPVRLAPHMPKKLMTSPGSDPEIVKNDHDIIEFDHESEFKIRVHNLDLNQHVNNTVYTQWALEALPAKFLFEFRPTDCIISFLKESFYPDTILSCVKIDNNSGKLITRHSIFLKKNKVKLANLTITWTKT